MEFFDAWGLRRPEGQRLVVTTWMDQAELGERYNSDAFARRVYEGAEVIRFAPMPVDPSVPVAS